MPGQSIAALEAALGAPPPAAFAQLPDDVVRQLAEDISAAKTHRSEALGTAIENSLGHLPAMLRGSVRKVLGL